MTEDLQQLVGDTIKLTGAVAPVILDADAPVLSTEALNNDDFYLVGLIGGKEVGKSALVNAIVGQSITPETGFGPGTEMAIAYVHHSRVEAVGRMLEKEIPGRLVIVRHSVVSLTRQVLVDLPDIDSRFESHVGLTRRMLRHLLYPIWLTSIEKYADRVPQQMLSRVAEGNSTDNFLFCLNKADQLNASQASELAEDYANRISSLLKIDHPKVWLVSAHQPDRFDLPSLREHLSRDRTKAVVNESRLSAGAQQKRTLIAWIDDQRLEARLARFDRLLDQAEEMVSGRIVDPLLETLVPKILQDPGHRLAMAEDAIGQRLSGWPIVRLINSILRPVTTLIQRNLSSSATTSPADLVNAAIQSTPRSASSLVQATFAHLRQSNPEIPTLYEHDKLWESMAADRQVDALRQALAGCIDMQRSSIGQRYDGFWVNLLAPVRWVLTLGAAIWFPIGQPLCKSALNGATDFSLFPVLRLLVEIISAEYLLKQSAWLLLYFFSLWLLLRWNTHRRVDRMLRQWDAPGQCLLDWADELLEPIRRERDQARQLIKRTEELRK